MEVSGQIHNLATLPLGNTIRIHVIEDWLGPRVGMDILDWRKIP